MRFGQPETAQTDSRKTTWFVHAYLHTDASGVLPLDEGVLGNLQLGGKRNYGYGVVELHDTQMVDLESLDYARLEEADEHRLELLSPFVLQSEYPGVSGASVPNWWGRTDSALRRRPERIVEGSEHYRIETVDHGQSVRYTGNRPIETAKAGIERIGTHSKYGFGELRVVPVEEGTG